MGRSPLISNTSLRLSIRQDERSVQDFDRAKPADIFLDFSSWSGHYDQQRIASQVSRKHFRQLTLLDAVEAQTIVDEVRKALAVEICLEQFDEVSGRRLDDLFELEKRQLLRFPVPFLIELTCCKFVKGSEAPVQVILYSRAGDLEVDLINEDTGSGCSNKLKWRHHSRQ